MGTCVANILFLVQSMSKKTLLLLMAIYPLIGLAGGALIGLGLYFLWPVIDHGATSSTRAAVWFAPTVLFAFVGLIESIQELIGHMKAAKDHGQD